MIEVLDGTVHSPPFDPTPSKSASMTSRSESVSGPDQPGPQMADESVETTTEVPTSPVAMTGSETAVRGPANGDWRNGDLARNADDPTDLRVFKRDSWCGFDSEEWVRIQGDDPGHPAMWYGDDEMPPRLVIVTASVG